MPLYHTDDQAMLADTARQFMADEGNIAKQLRHYRDMNCKDGFGHGLWKQFAELGLTGVLVAEADGGLGMGHVEAGIVLEEIGRNLTPSPFLTSSVMAATALGAASDGAAVLGARDAGIRCGQHRRGGAIATRGHGLRSARASGQSSVMVWIGARRSVKSLCLAMREVGP